MRAINVLLSILVGLALGLLVLEGGLRLIGMTPPRSIQHFDPALGWSKEPGAKVRKKTKEYDVEIVVNELGLRDDPMQSPAKAAGTYRVVCLGDSFTLGFTVERDDLFVDQLEHRWRAEGREVEVLNAGTEGYSTDQEVAWLLEHGEAFQPDLVLLFPYENDIFWNGETLYSHYMKPRFDADGQLEERTLVEPPKKGWIARLALANLLGRFSAKGPGVPVFQPDGALRPIMQEWGPLLVSPPGFVTEAVARTEGALKALKAKCAELGAALVVAPIPSHSAIEPAHRDVHAAAQLGGLPLEAWSPDLPVETFLELCRRQEIASLDARPALRARQEAGDALYYRSDWHLNAKGNEVFAGFLHDELDRQSPPLLPTASQDTGSLAAHAHAPESSGPRWPFVFLGLWVALSVLYSMTYRDEPRWRPPLEVGALLAVMFTIVLGGKWLIGLLPPAASRALLLLFVLGILTFVVYKLGRRVGTIVELFVSFTRRGHWYLMPLVVVLLTIGSLLVVAASSPLVAPFIYTLF